MRRCRLVTLSLLTLIICLAGAGAARAEMACDLASQAAASLLLPYFEVDLENENGKATLFAVGNVDSSAVLARAVLWTNWGNPVAAFDFGLEGHAVRTFNLRDILAGRLPETRSPGARPDGRHARCSNPVALPRLDPAALRALLTGQPSLTDGLCYGSAVDGGRLATGYVTVDVVNDCSGAAGLMPLDEGYFRDCASGLASNDNVLWGDFFFIDPSSDHAKGERMVALHADQSRFGADECVDPPCGNRNPTSFYDARGNRMPLPRAYQTRFLEGGGFDAGTELLVWIHGRIRPFRCDAVSADRPTVYLESRSERGVVLGSTDIVTVQAGRLSLADTNLQLGDGFGRVEVSANAPSGDDVQLWVMPLLAAEGRYSVGFGAVPVRDFWE
jgi:hypothetical protein